MFLRSVLAKLQPSPFALCDDEKPKKTKEQIEMEEIEAIFKENPYAASDPEEME